MAEILGPTLEQLDAWGSMDDQKQAQHDALYQRAAAAIQADEDRARFAGPLTLTTDYGEVA